MSAFDRVRANAVRAGARHVCVLPPDGFAQTWSRRPHQPAKIGLRSISESEIEAAQSRASSAGWERHPNPDDSDARIEIINDNFVTNILARACVQPDNVDAPFFAPAPESLIRAALTPGGIRRLWAAFIEMQIKDAPCAPEASDEELAFFADRLLEGIGDLEPDKATRLRRLVYAAMQEV